MRKAFSSVRSVVAGLAFMVGILASGSPAPGQEIDAETRREALVEVAAVIEDRYPDPLVGKGIADTIREQLHEGDGATDANSLVAEVSELLRSLIPDQGFDFYDTLESSDAPDKSVYQERSESGLRTVRTLEDQTAYLEFDGLPGDRGSISAVRQALAGQPEVRAIILDVRDNIGGSGDMVVLLCSHLLEAESLLYTFSDRSGAGPRQMKTSAPSRHFGTATPVFVLTSGNTLSSAEALAFILQDYGRAVVVGERTPGMANPIKKYPIAGHFELEVPFVLLRYGKSGGTYGGVGVIPDIEVPADSALEAALEELTQSR